MRKIWSCFFSSLLYILSLLLQDSDAQNLSSNTNLLERYGLVSFRPIDLYTDPRLSLSSNFSAPMPVGFYSEREIAIQKELNLKVGHGIICYSPTGSESGWIDVDSVQITPYTWRWADFEMKKPDGTLTKVSLLRPISWLKALGAVNEGDIVSLDMPEIGAKGPAVVTGIRLNQLDTRFWDEHRTGDYVVRPVTGRFEHESRDVYELVFGDTNKVGVTGNHRIWSEDRGGWVEASYLNIGERVKTRTGSVTVKNKKHLKGLRKVYNIEVYRDHNYHVSLLSVLVHNNYFEKVVIMPAKGKVIEKGSAKKIDAAIDEIVEGGGTTRPTPYEGRENPTWAGSTEYEVPGLSNNYRILKQEKTLSDGTVSVRYGWSDNHYKNIQEFKKKTP